MRLLQTDPPSLMRGFWVPISVRERQALVWIFLLVFLWSSLCLRRGRIVCHIVNSFIISQLTLYVTYICSENPPSCFLVFLNSSRHLGRSRLADICSLERDSIGGTLDLSAVHLAVLFSCVLWTLTGVWVCSDHCWSLLHCCILDLETRSLSYLRPVSFHQISVQLSFHKFITCGSLGSCLFICCHHWCL